MVLLHAAGAAGSGFCPVPRTPLSILRTLCLALVDHKTMIVERLKPGVITVGPGRGFVVEVAGERLVITAAH